MQIPVLIEPIPRDRFRATSGDPLRLETEGGSRDEAVRKIRDLLERRIAAGAELVEIDVTSSEHPLAGFAGMLRDEPLLDAWREARAEYRSEKEAEGDAP